MSSVMYLLAENQTVNLAVQSDSNKFPRCIRRVVIHVWTSLYQTLPSALSCRRVLN